MVPLRLRTWPNSVTCLRPLCTPVFLLCCVQAQETGARWARWGVLGLFGVIAGSDWLDGWLARRLTQNSLQGRTLDHVCDVFFVVSALGGFVSLGLAPWWLPAAILWSFGLYAYDSWWRTAHTPQRHLLGSRLGHLGGILNYGAVGVLAGQLWFGRPYLPRALLSIGFLSLALLAGVAGAERLWRLWQATREPSTMASHPAGPATESTSQADCSSA